MTNKKWVRQIGASALLFLGACAGGGVNGSGSGGSGSQFQSNAEIQVIPYETKLNLLTSARTLNLATTTTSVQDLMNAKFQHGAFNPDTNTRDTGFTTGGMRSWYSISASACDQSLKVKENVDRLFPSGDADPKEFFNAIVGRPATDSELEFLNTELAKVTGLTSMKQRQANVCFVTMTYLGLLLR